MKALLYLRVSSQKQASEGHGIDSQEQRCRDFAERKGYEVVEVFPDEAVSGALFERPAMGKLISYLDSHPVEEYVIIFDDLARLARDLDVHIKLKSELVSRGAKLECPNFTFEDSPEGLLIENVVQAQNQYQRQANRRQVIQKMQARLEDGFWPFMPPMGLRNQRDGARGKVLKPVEPLASVLKKAIEGFASSKFLTPEETRQFMANRFRSNNLRKDISLSWTMQILKNPLYGGFIEYKPWNVSFRKARHDGIVTFETYQLVQKRLDARSKGKDIRNNYSKDFPLRSHVFCSGCNRPLRASWNKGRSANYPNYWCQTKDCLFRYKVTGKYKIENEFKSLISELQPDSGLVELTERVLQERWEMFLEKNKERKNVYQKEADEIEVRKSKILKRINATDDDVLIKIYEDELRKAISEEEDIKQKLAEWNDDSYDFGTALNKVFEVIKQPQMLWESEDYRYKNAIINMYFDGYLKYDYNTGFGTTVLAYPLSLITKNRPMKGDLCGDVEE